MNRRRTAFGFACWATLIGCFYLLTTPRIAAAGRPQEPCVSGHLTLRAVLKALRRHPTHPEPWLNMACLAMKKNDPLTAYEYALIGKKYSSPGRRLAQEESLLALLDLASHQYATALVADREVPFCPLKTASEDCIEPSDLEDFLIEDEEVPSDLLEARFDCSPHINPSRYSNAFAEILSSRIEEFRDLGLGAAARILEADLDAFRREEVEYAPILSAGRTDPEILATFIHSNSPNRFRKKAGEDLASIVLKQAFDRAKAEGNTRGALHDLLAWHHRIESDSSADFHFHWAADMVGLSYIRQIVFANQDILLSAEVNLDSSSLGPLGDLRTIGFFVSVAKKGEMILVKDDWVRGLVTHKDLQQEPAGWVNPGLYDRFSTREIWGDASPYLTEKGLQWKDVVTPTPPETLPNRFSPATLVKKETDLSGGLVDDLIDFVDEHPVASALIVGSVMYATSDNQRTELGPTPASELGSLGIRVAHREVLQFTVKEFEVELEGDAATRFTKRKDGSGDALFRSGYATFLSLPPGLYSIRIRGRVEKRGALTPFALSGSYQFRGGNITCDVNIDTERIICSD